MPIHVSDSQLDQIELGREPGIIVRSVRRKKGYAVIPQQVYDQVWPLLQYVAMQLEHAPKNCESNESIDGKNIRRMALVNKKYDHVLTAAEKKELAMLTVEVDEFLGRKDQTRNKILELLLAGLKQQAFQKGKR